MLTGLSCKRERCIHLQWGITVANISDFKRPPELLSYPQQLAVTATGLIWTRYSTVINPVSLPNSFQ